MEANQYPPFKVPSVEDTKSDDFFQPYVQTLRKIFAEILGWTGAEADAHIERKLQQDHFRVWFGHTTPCDDAAHEIVPASLRRKLFARRISNVGIHDEIWHVLEGSRETFNEHPDTDPEYDWQRARDEIADIINDYERKCNEAG